MPMISRCPMWMLLATCALWGSGASALAMAASEDRAGDNRTIIAQLESPVAQAQPAEEQPAEAQADGVVDRPTLSLGSRGPLVIQIQLLLQEKDLYSGAINGDFDLATSDAVKAFQQEQGLDTTGVVDRGTWGPLTGEASPEIDAEAVEEAPSMADLPGENDAETAPSGRRLILAAVALLGLGAGGFGLWKILAVPVPQPLAYPDSLDDEGDYDDDDYEELTPRTAPPSQGGKRGAKPLATEAAMDDSPITVPAATLIGNVAQPPSSSQQSTDALESESLDLIGLESTDLPGLASIDLPDKAGPALLRGQPRAPLDPSKAGTEAAGRRKRPQDASPTDTAVAIATQSAIAAAQEKAAGQNQPDKTPRRVPQSKPAAGDAPSLPKANAVRAGSSGAKSSKSSLAKSAAKMAVSRSSLTPPPPPPSEITRATPGGALEQPELVTTRVVRADIVETLMTDLQCADPAKRRKAIWELGQRSDSRAIQPLVSLMTHSDSRQRSLILAALSEIGTQTLKPMKQALAISLQDDNAEVRKNAIRDLTRIYDLVAQISHLLNTALDDPDPEVQDTARWALKQLNRIRSNAGLEGSNDQPMLQQSVSPPENLSSEGTFQQKPLPRVDPRS